MRKQFSFEIDNVISFKEKLLHYAKNIERFCVLDSSNSSEFSGNTYNCIAGIDAMEEISPCENSFEALKKFHQKKNDWLFGYLSYDLKDEIEPPTLPSPNGGRSEEGGGIRFPQMHFFQPKYVFRLKGNKVEIGFLPEVSSEEEVENLFHEILNCPLSLVPRPSSPKISQRISKQNYIRTIKRIKNHIHRGDIYEMNYCMEFFSEQAEINPVGNNSNGVNPAEVFLKLNETSQAPFSAFYRMNDNYLLCASPERFLKKDGRKIISQPIKGTARRGVTISEDIELKELLLQNEKEKSENVMIVDLVRNDLSRTCDNVRVDELFGVYTFKQWHQMISTVSGEMRNDVHFADVIKNAFPMGSMTGAPKIRAMELIEQYEKTKRGLYSGAVGYITPASPLNPLSSRREEKGAGVVWGEADFDFNVVIRSILYNSSSKYLSFQVGSAITANSIPENEYEECLLKTKGMFEALKAQPQPSDARNLRLSLGGEHEVEKSESVF
ncbi:MAG: anthranilate synthase component I family protein [Bacteroidetes bacterium]|nr:anthranilate synthase component I family protein [Bacteroidota bacterium]